MIGILDYGLGNINAFANIYNNLNIAHKLVKTIDDISDVDKFILPGVGAFDYAMSQFNASGLRDVVEKKVLIDKVPILGICVGMQILANRSDEGSEDGLGWIDGEVKLMETHNIVYKTKLPHMGWNSVKISRDDLFLDLPKDPRFYFLHSYYFHCKSGVNSIATSTHGKEFTCSVRNENIYGVQFHPEKSHSNGIQILKNFAIK